MQREYLTFAVKRWFPQAGIEPATLRLTATYAAFRCIPNLAGTGADRRDQQAATNLSTHLDRDGCFRQFGLFLPNRYDNFMTLAGAGPMCPSGGESELRFPCATVFFSRCCLEKRLRSLVNDFFLFSNQSLGPKRDQRILIQISGCVHCLATTHPARLRADSGF